MLKWETYTKKIPEKKRLDKLAVLICLSYAIQICIGTQVDIPLPNEEEKTSVLQRFRHI